MRNSNFLAFRPTLSSATDLPPRDLDERTKLRMEEMLCGFPQPKLIRVIAVFGDAEHIYFAQQILDYLEVSGWPTEPTFQIVAQSIPHTGVFIRMRLNDNSVIEIVVGSKY